MYNNRPKRVYLDDEFYFVTVKTQYNKPVFKNNNYADIFEPTLMFLKGRSDFELSAGVLLSDHFHLLLMPIKKNIFEIMHNLKSYTASKISEQILSNRFASYRRGVEASPAVSGSNDGYNNDAVCNINNENKNSPRQGFHTAMGGLNGVGVNNDMVDKIINQNINPSRQGFHALSLSSKRKTISIKIWQRSFHCHVIGNDWDFQNHYNYIFWNPKKHGYVSNSENWPCLWA